MLMASLGDEMLDSYMYQMCIPFWYHAPTCLLATRGRWHQDEGYPLASSYWSSSVGVASSSLTSYRHFDSYQEVQLMALVVDEPGSLRKLVSNQQEQQQNIERIYKEYSLC